uniref:Uncharacterized protein n=1 Tax=Arundo donax TaxID=35708 RepID=A0A0A9ARU9_ARUDO
METSIFFLLPVNYHVHQLNYILLP